MLLWLGSPPWPGSAPVPRPLAWPTGYRRQSEEACSGHSVRDLRSLCLDRPRQPLAQRKLTRAKVAR